MTQFSTTLDVWRPSGQWTTLFRYDSYAPALWALLFDPSDVVYASDYFGNDWPRVSAEAVITDLVVGYQTTVIEARKRLVDRLGPLRGYAEAWRALSLSSALAICIAGIPNAWKLRLDASGAALHHGGRYSDLLQLAVRQATSLATDPPDANNAAVERLLDIAHAMNPETILHVPEDGLSVEQAWPQDALRVEGALLGVPVECPTSHVESMTRSRRRWQASW